MGWFKWASGTGFMFDRADTDGNRRISVYTNHSSGEVIFYTETANAGGGSLAANVWSHWVVVRRSGVFYGYQDGVQVATFVDAGSKTSNDATAVLKVGVRYNNANPLGGSVALFRASATAPTAAQIAKIYEDEKFLFQENAGAVLHGTSNTVTALAHDSATDLLHVGTSQGRSVFQGLRRVSNTTDAITAAISASNNLVAEE